MGRVVIWGKSIPSRGNSQGKGLEVGMCLMGSRMVSLEQNERRGQKKEGRLHVAQGGGGSRRRFGAEKGHDLASGGVLCGG